MHFPSRTVLYFFLASLFIKKSISYICVAGHVRYGTIRPPHPTSRGGRRRGGRCLRTTRAYLLPSGQQRGISYLFSMTDSPSTRAECRYALVAPRQAGRARGTPFGMALRPQAGRDGTGWTAGRPRPRLITRIQEPYFRPRPPQGQPTSSCQVLLKKDVMIYNFNVKIEYS